jgi:prevent-host-death family protein
MTYSNWKISDAKAHFSEVVGACREEPQLLYNRGKPVAAVIGIDSFEAYQRFMAESQRPSISSLLDELDALNQQEADFGEAPRRVNRPQAELD